MAGIRHFYGLVLTGEFGVFMPFVHGNVTIKKYAFSFEDCVSPHEAIKNKNCPTKPNSF